MTANVDPRELIKKGIEVLELQIHLCKVNGYPENHKLYRDARKTLAKCIATLAHIDSSEWVERK